MVLSSFKTARPRKRAAPATGHPIAIVDGLGFGRRPVKLARSGGGDRPPKCPATRLSRHVRLTRFGQLPDEPALVRELPGLVLRVDEGAVDLDVEDAAPARDQLGVDAERFFQTGSQTDRFRLVVSGVAVGDGDFHGRARVRSDRRRP